MGCHAHDYTRTTQSTHSTHREKMRLSYTQLVNSLEKILYIQKSIKKMCKRNQQK